MAELGELDEADEDMKGGWTTVARRGRRSDEELRQEFWEDIGFPTAASRTWETSPSSSESATPVVASSKDQEKEGSSGMSVGSGRGRSLPPKPAMSASVVKPVRLGWRGPLPRPRISPPAVLGMFFPPSTAAGEEADDRAAEADSDPSIAGHGGMEIQTIPTAGPMQHVDLSRPNPWSYLGRCFAGLWQPIRSIASRFPESAAAATPIAGDSEPGSSPPFVPPASPAGLASSPCSKSACVPPIFTRSFAEVVASPSAMAGAGGSGGGGAGGQAGRAQQGQGMAQPQLPATMPPMIFGRAAGPGTGPAIRGNMAPVRGAATPAAVSRPVAAPQVVPPPAVNATAVTTVPFVVPTAVSKKKGKKKKKTNAS